MEKGKSVKETFRLEEKDHNALMEKVKDTGVKKSDYIRQILLRDIYNRNTNSNIMEQLCRLSTKCTLILEECEMSERKRLLLTKEGKSYGKSCNYNTKGRL